ncbi:hypothetical protein KIPB_016532 [Kipferlia bialata]|uniref:Uncharacterized protein n=1 Tax=Kipferlia bialata TaxID=797122 RepID=A0A9K3GQU8_9EUKA|nr:hypothetical protein KIPB_016532 [Kipferlia bialata]|eukprot:g16532.t1
MGAQVYRDSTTRPLLSVPSAQTDTDTAAGPTRSVGVVCGARLLQASGVSLLSCVLRARGTSAVGESECIYTAPDTVCALSWCEAVPSLVALGMQGGGVLILSAEQGWASTSDLWVWLNRQ